MMKKIEGKKTGKKWRRKKIVQNVENEEFSKKVLTEIIREFSIG